MEKIILTGILFIEVLFTISLGKSYYDKGRDRMAIRKYLILCLSYTVNVATYIFMSLTINDSIRFIAYMIMWSTQVIFWGSLLILGLYVLDIKSKIIDFSITLMAYVALFSCFVDSLIKGEKLVETKWGYYNSGAGMMISYIPHAIAYLIVIFDVIYMQLIYHRKAKKNREKYLLKLFFITYFPVCIGILFELGLIVLGIEFFPMGLVTSLLSISFMKNMMEYNRGIKIVREDFDKWIGPDFANPVVICDDKQRVIFMNKRSEIVSNTSKIEFLKRCLDDIFLISKDDEEKLFANNNNTNYSIKVASATNGRNIELAIEPIVDKFGEVLSNIVTIYNLEEEESVTIDTSLTKGSRALIIDENASGASLLEGMLSVLDVVSTKTYSESSALYSIRDNTYDIILIDHTKKSSFGLDVASAIRKIPGDYYKKVPIIFCTDCAIDDVYNDFLEAGFNDYLLKPVSAKKLQELVLKWGWEKLTKEEAKKEEISNDKYDIYEAFDSLINSFKRTYENKQNLLTLFNVAGIKKIAQSLELMVIVEKTIDIESAVLVENEEKVYRLFGELLVLLSNRKKM